MNISIKKAFNIVIKNSIVVLPLVLCVLVNLLSNLATVASNALAGMIFLVSMNFLCVAIIAGWLNVVKFLADNCFAERKEEEQYLFKIPFKNLFFSGVSEYFIQILVLFLFILFVFSFSLVLGQKLFPINWMQLIEHPQDMKFIETFAHANIKYLSMWLLYLVVISHVLQFLLMFWLPVMYYETKNPFKALGLELKFLFKKFFSNLALYLFIFVLSVVVALFSLISNINAILSFIGLMLSFYFIAYIIVLLFVYYKRTIMMEKVKEMNKKDVFVKAIESETETDVEKE